ncbi:FHA domain-containing protein FhaB/FipA [Okibacterium fritillariae]|uniref:Inner membrane component of T3SS domain-containing protein n=1 Tax=Okibacterium fritillariae TaxID=123320 RepID=A0A1T5I924_9MICO|nr:FHA domain-containing protein [Okibacterium fritillariae]SKC35412.1 Inner membrane component of T3SS domain-containing protein [Okibacterium fritillariae]
MSELTFLVLRIAFLVLLWLFVFGVVYALRSDMFGQGTRKPADAKGARASGSPAAAGAAGAGAGAGLAAASAAAATASKPKPRQQAAAPVASGRRHEAATIHNTTRLVITAGPKEGLEVPLGREPLTIGRSSDSTLVIRDDYTSSHHARLLLWNEDWMVQDLDSTNGTYLGGKRIASPTQITLGTPIKVGATTFELRR